MGRKIGVSGKCSAEHQEFVRSIEINLPPFATPEPKQANFDDCAKLTTDGRSILANVKLSDSSRVMRVLVMQEEFSKTATTVINHAGYFDFVLDIDLVPPSVFDVQKFDRAVRMILQYQGKSLPIPLPIIPIEPSLLIPRPFPDLPDFDDI